MKRALGFLVFVCWFWSGFIFAEPNSASGRTLVVIPFTNTSPTPGLDWMSEAFPELLREQLNSPLLYVASRADLLRAYDRQGVPVSLQLSRATLYRVAEQMDVDYAVFGSYRYDGSALTATAQLLDMRALKLLPAVTESGPLPQFDTVQSALTWDLLHSIYPDFSPTKAQYLAGHTPVRLDALEHYMRGVTATSLEQKESHFKDSVRLNPSYARAWLELGKAYLERKSPDAAITSLEHVPASSPAAREANFYLGLAAYDRGDFARAATAFESVAARLPLAEVYNNLGVVAARRGQKSSAQYFEKAVRNDPGDADYHFNYGVALSKAGDNAAASREWRLALEHRPSDAEARSLLSPSPGSVVPAASVVKTPAERIKRSYSEDDFRQLTTQMQGWVEQRFARSDSRAHARFHLERGTELLAYGFVSDAEAEFRHARTVDPSSLAPFLGLADAALARGDAREARSQAEASLRLRESAGAYLVLARLDLSENRVEAAADNLKQASRLDPANTDVQSLKREVAARLAEKP